MIEMIDILYPVASIGGLGVLFGAGLGVAGEVFKVEVDPRVTAILDVMPGANCGGCGFPGCGGLANAIVAGQAPVNACPVGGSACAEAIGGIMGVEAGGSDPITAYIMCAGTHAQATEQYEYFGIKDCKMAMQLAGGGSKTCAYGCLGLGTCIEACGFGAINIVDGIAVVDKEKCVSCGKCVTECPKNLIQMIKSNHKIKMNCSSKAAGKVVMQACKVGCISCKICEKQCPFDSIHVIDGIAVINYETCKSCGICANKCPKGVITGKKPAPPAAEKPAAAPAKPAEAKAEAPAEPTEAKAEAPAKPTEAKAEAPAEKPAEAKAEETKKED